MTITSPAAAPPKSQSRTRLLAQGLLMSLVRFAALTGASLLYGLSISSDQDPVGAGLVGFTVTAALTGLWSMFDGWRRPLPTGAVAWALTSALLVVLGPLPQILSYPTAEGGWTGMGDYLAMVSNGAGFMFALTAVPAALGLFIGRLIRSSARPTA